MKKPAAMAKKLTPPAGKRRKEVNIGIRVDADLHTEVREAADKIDRSMSWWMIQAAKEKLARDAN